MTPSPGNHAPASTCPTLVLEAEHDVVGGGAAELRDAVNAPVDLESSDATEVGGEERNRSYRRLAEMRPAFAGQETRTHRVSRCSD